jgi:hypothetical protein
MANQDETTDEENDIPNAGVPGERTTTKAAAEEDTSFDTDRLRTMSRKKVTALTIIATIVLLMAAQVVLTAFDLRANLQTRDSVTQTRELQICEANINLTASSQTDATQKLKACLTAQN